jgi:hypothetical protein
VFGDQSFVFHWDSGQVVPNIWHFLYKLNITSTNLLIIKLQLKFFDYIVLTVRILFISSICSQIQVLVICLLKSKAIFDSRHSMQAFYLRGGRGGQGGTLYFKIEPSIWGACIVSFF